ncbi:MAG: hypothetical protein CL935_00150 [Deltaproteobacteria bacterium]|nr:hypothetical protein [Deltaproteobacteria bacterium]|tara:strand:- start:337 stop:951 length:615 start_codon:yes stop_codon:yes gene_type:complete
MKKFILCVATLFSVNSFVIAADSAGNRKDQIFRVGQKSGIHLMYLISSPFVLEFPGEELTFGFVYGSGDLKSTTTSGSSTVEDIWTFTTTELTGRYYLGNSFNIPFGVAIYNIHKDDWTYSNVNYELDYNMTQLNFGIGNDWTYDWGGFLAIDWYQGGIKLSDKITVTRKSGTETSATKAAAEEESTDVNAFGGALILTFGFGF